MTKQQQQKALELLRLIGSENGTKREFGIAARAFLQTVDQPKKVVDKR